MITRGEGIYLFDDAGHRYVDLVASWWSCSLGHSHPRLVAALQRQAGILQHSILGDLSHPPAVELASALAHLMPTPDRHVLFASDGASSVEAALKIALMLAHHKGQPGRIRFASLCDAYHGDTLGAVGVGYLEAFHRALKPALTQAIRIPLPSAGKGIDPADVLCPHRRELAAVIVEPLCLGAAGMIMYESAFLRRIADVCAAWDIPLIVDEIAMGFGRTGTMFAFEQAGIDPDMVCVGKAMTGGAMPMSAVIVKDRLYAHFADEPIDNTFYHGHTFSGHPLSAAAALETLRIYADDQIVARAARLGARMAERLHPFSDLDTVKEVRCLGLIGAVECQPDEAAPNRSHRVSDLLRERGYLSRPLDPVIYLMPPLTITEEELDQAIQAVGDALRDAG